MAFTLTQLSALEEAIASGELSVQYDGKKVEYRSLDDLQKAYNMVRGSLLASGQLSDAGTNRGPSSLAIFSRD
ncbi:phage head-tail joining protein [Cupriavidus basilensis]